MGEPSSGSSATTESIIATTWKVEDIVAANPDRQVDADELVWVKTAHG